MVSTDWCNLPDRKRSNESFESNARKSHYVSPRKSELTLMLLTPLDFSVIFLKTIVCTSIISRTRSQQYQADIIIRQWIIEKSNIVWKSITRCWKGHL